MKYKPLGAWILLKEVPAPSKTTRSGIILEEVDDENGKVGFAEVVRLGTGVMLASGAMTQFNVKEGDSVRFRRYAGIEIEIEDQKYYQLYESDILGVESEESLHSVKDILKNGKTEN